MLLNKIISLFCFPFRDSTYDVTLSSIQETKRTLRLFPLRPLLLEHSSFTTSGEETVQWCSHTVRTMMNFTLITALLCTFGKYIDFSLNTTVSSFPSVIWTESLRLFINNIIYELCLFASCWGFMNRHHVCLFQAGSLSRFLSFTLWRFSLVKTSHCCAPTLPLSCLTYSGSNWTTDTTSAASPIWRALMPMFHSVMVLKMENLTWHPTALPSFWRSNKWMYLTPDCISVEIKQKETGQWLSVQHI